MKRSPSTNTAAVENAPTSHTNAELQQMLDRAELAAEITLPVEKFRALVLQAMSGGPYEQDAVAALNKWRDDWCESLSDRAIASLDDALEMLETPKQSATDCAEG